MYSAIRPVFFVLCVFLRMNAFSQNISGSVFSEQGGSLPFSSVFIKGTSQGVTANSEGRFSLNLAPGVYTLVCQHVGYAKQERKVTVGKTNEEIIFILSLQKFQLKEVIIKSGDEDPAYEIIRQAIKKRSFYNSQVKTFTCEAYIKGLVKLRNMPSRILGKKVPDEDRKEMRLDSSGKGIVFLSESITRVARKEDKVKLEVISGRQSGSNGVGFNFPTFISLYENNVTMFTSRINPRGFISPIADNALNYYRYKFMGSFFEDGKEINTIRVIPKHSYEPVYSGIINITEGDWSIHSCDLLLTKTSGLELIDSLQMTQIFSPVSNDVWRVKNQLLHFNFNQFGIDAVGNFINLYSKYDLDPHFPANYFNRVVIKYDTSVNKRTTAYWDSIRPVPLEPEEVKDYQIKDSIYRYERDSSLSQSNIDSLKKKQGPLTLKQVFWSGVNRTHYNTSGNYTWELDPILKSLQYNTVEGFVVNVDGNVQRYIKHWKTNVTVSPNLRYGFSDHMFNAWLGINFRTRDWSMHKKLKRESWDFSGGTRVSQFNKESNISTLGNSLGTLIFGHNNLKIYKNIFGDVSFAKRFESGFRFLVDALYEDRVPLDNTTDFVIIKKNKAKLTPNYPFLISQAQFSRHQALITSVELSIKPGQRYIQFPNRKVAIGSKFPTFTFNFSHGFKDILGSDVDFDKWKFTVSDDANLKLAGSIKYKVAIAGFLNNKKVFIQDYQFFNGNQSQFAKEYMNTFQLLPYYSAYTTAPLYGMINAEHHLNGLLSNKIPFFKKLKWTFLYGTNDFYVNKNNNFVEVFAGVENIFKVMRFDVVAGSRNGQKFNVDYRVGFGGAIGGSINASRLRGRGAGF